MPLAGRLLVASGLILAAHLLVISIHRGLDPAPAELPAVGPTTLPDRLGDFVGHDEPLDERLVAGSDADVMLNRVYRNRLGDFVLANVGVWTRYQKAIPHAPEMCYTRAGWEIASRRSLTVPRNGEPPVEIRQFVFQRGVSRIVVAFWVHLDGDTFADHEGVRRVRQRLRLAGGNLKPLVKVMLQADGSDIEQAEAQIARFIEHLIPYTEAVR